MVEPQASAKPISEKPLFVDAMAETLGKIWCPIHGLLVFEDYVPSKRIVRR